MKRIAIIGGGLTGLTAAYRLSEKGYEVTILERNDFVGGLVSGFEIQGTNIEKTYHHIFKTDIDIINLVKELGIEDKIMWCKSSMGIYYNGKIYAFGTPVSLIKFSPLKFFNRIRYGIVLLYLAKTRDWKKFAKTSAYVWCKKWSGSEAMKVIWEPLLKGKFERYYDKVSMAWLWARVHVRGNSQEKGGEKLGYFDGGFNIIIEKLLEKLKANNVKIITNAEVTSIKLEDQLLHKGGMRNTKDQVIVKINGEDEVFDKVLATVPSYVFAKMIENNNGLEKDYLQKLNGIDYEGAVVMVFSSDQDLGKYYWNNINDLSFPFLAFLNHTKLVDKSKYNNKYVYYIGTYVPHDHKYFTMSEEEISSLWFEYVKKMFGEFDEAKVIDKHLFKLKNAQHIVDLDYESKIPDHKTPLENVYLANFSQIFPEDRATNNAIRDGNKISEMMME